MMKTLAVCSEFVDQNYRPGTQEAKRAWRSDDDIDEEDLEEMLLAPSELLTKV